MAAGNVVEVPVRPLRVFRERHFGARKGEGLADKNGIRTNGPMLEWRMSVQTLLGLAAMHGTHRRVVALQSVPAGESGSVQAECTRC
jgi:hypothetical protein